LIKIQSYLVKLLHILFIYYKPLSSAMMLLLPWKPCRRWHLTHIKNFLLF